MSYALRFFSFCSRAVVATKTHHKLGYMFACWNCLCSSHKSFFHLRLLCSRRIAFFARQKSHGWHSSFYHSVVSFNFHLFAIVVPRQIYAIIKFGIVFNVCHNDYDKQINISSVLLNRRYFCWIFSSLEKERNENYQPYLYKLIRRPPWDANTNALLFIGTKQTQFRNVKTLVSFLVFALKAHESTNLLL